MGGCVWQVLSIDGAPTDGWDGDRAAKVLRGKSGSSVTVKFARRTEQIPGVAGRPEPPPTMEYKQVHPLCPSYCFFAPRHAPLAIL